MIDDIKYDNLTKFTKFALFVLFLLFVLLETSFKLKVVKKFTQEALFPNLKKKYFQIYKWIILLLFLLIINRKNGSTQFVLFYFIYQIFNMIDFVYV